MAWKRTQDAETPEAVATAEYNSALFEMFVSGLGKLGPDAGVLDLGPTTSDNLMFWVRRGRRVAAVDAASRHRQGRSCDLGSRRFGGILCWNALCELPPDVAKELATDLTRRLLPGGYLFAIFDGDGRQPTAALRYRIVSDSRLAFEPRTSPGALRAVSTSEIESLLTGLRPTRMTVMRHGAREALGQSPAPVGEPFPDARRLGRS